MVVGATRAARVALGLSAAASRPRRRTCCRVRRIERLTDGERAVVQRALARADGNVSAAARNLGISRATLHRKLGAVRRRGCRGNYLSTCRRIATGCSRRRWRRADAPGSTRHVPSRTDRTGRRRFREAINMNKVEFSRVAKSPFKARYGNFIGGAVGRAGRGAVFRQHVAGHRPGALRSRPLGRRRRRAGARRRPRGRRTPGAGPRRPSGPIILNQIADRMEENLDAAGARRDLGQRQADPRDHWRRTSRWPSTTSATSPAASAPRKARCRRSTTTPSPITSTNRWASSARSSRGTSRS